MWILRGHISRYLVWFWLYAKILVLSQVTWTSGTIIQGTVHTTPTGICKRMFNSENASNVFRPHYAGGIWKRNNHRSFWICGWGKLWQGKHIINVASSFFKSFVFKMFSFRTKTQSQRFQIFCFGKRFRKAPFSWQISVDGRPKLRFQISPA